LRVKRAIFTATTATTISVTTTSSTTIIDSKLNATLDRIEDIEDF